MSEMNELFATLQEYVRKAVAPLRDCTAEAFFTSTRTTEVALRNSQLLTQNCQEDAGVGFRVAYRKKVGFACTNTLTEEAIRKAAETALSIARVSREVPYFALPPPGPLPEVRGYDPRVRATSVEDIVDLARRALEAAESDPRVRVKSGNVVFQWGHRGVITSEGVDCEERATKAVLYLGGVGEYNGSVTGMSTELEYSRTADVNPEKTGDSVREKVTAMFNPQKLASFEGTVIFAPEAGSYQLTDALVDAVKGETVMAGRSAWAEKRGEKVGSDVFTLTDDPLLENGFSSRAFDDEGCPSRRTPLVERGVLRGFLHSGSTACALRMENTGNASRSAGGFDMIRSIIGSGYRTEPEVYPSNLVFSPGTKDKEALTSEVEKGVLVTSMGGFVQKGSGLISAQLSEAFFIEKGEIKYSVKEGMVSGVAFDWLKQISGVGRDVKQFENVVVPSIRVEGVRVVGG